MSSLDMRNAEDVCGYDAYKRVSEMDLKSLSMKACSNFDEKGARCARHLLLTNPDASTVVKTIGINYNEGTGKYTADNCKSGGRRKRRTKKSKNGGKSKKSGGRRRRRTQRRNR